jgi:hypothetical protein
MITIPRLLHGNNPFQFRSFNETGPPHICPYPVRLRNEGASENAGFDSAGLKARLRYSELVDAFSGNVEFRFFGRFRMDSAMFS